MKKFVLTFCIGSTLAMPATAAPTIEEIISQLEAQGYRDVTVSRTWLGRIRIEAESSTHEREIVFNKRTGEILRDFWEELENDQEDPDGEGEDPEEVGEEAEEDTGDADQDAADDTSEDTQSSADEDEGDDDNDDEGDDEEDDEDEDDS